MTVVVRGKRGPVRSDSRNVARGRETRQRIIDAARARIARDGFEALRLDDLARDAGISKAAVVKSAGGKASILLTIGEEPNRAANHFRLVGCCAKHNRCNGHRRLAIAVCCAAVYRMNSDIDRCRERATDRLRCVLDVTPTR